MWWRLPKYCNLLPGGPLFDDDVVVDMWRYLVQSERSYVDNLCAFTDEGLAIWCGWYVVYVDALCRNRAILTQFRYKDRAELTFWQSQDH